jgi:hypothetical protein
MDENPYKAPGEVDTTGRRGLLGLTIIEWIVLFGVELVIVALLLPDVDDARTRVINHSRMRSVEEGPVKSAQLH